MAAPSARIEFGFGSTWQTEDASITWTDVTGYVNDRRKMVETFRGATAAHGKAGTGTVDFVLNNRDRRFDPLHAAGPHFGDLVPGVPVRVLADIGAGPTTLPIARGFVRSWPQVPDGATFSTVPIDVFDGSQNLSLAPTPTSVYDLEVLADSPRAYWKLTDPSGSPEAADSSGNGLDGVYRYEPSLTNVDEGLVIGEPARRFDGVRQAIDVRDAAVRLAWANLSAVEATIEAWVRTDSTPATGQYDTIYYQSGNAFGEDLAWLVITDAGRASIMWNLAGVGGYQYRTDEAWTDGVTHHIVGNVDYPGNQGSVYVDGAGKSVATEAQVSNYHSAVTIGGHPNPRNTRDYFDGEISHVAIYDTPLSPTRIAAHHEAGTNPWGDDRSGERITRLLDLIDWPADLRDVDTGQTYLGPAVFKENDDVLSYLRLIEESEDGRLFIAADGKLTFRDRFWPFLAGAASQVTFTDADSSGYVYANFIIDPASDDLVLNAYRYSRRNGAELRGEDTTSRDRYGFREDTKSDLLVRTDNEVRARGQWTLTTRAAPLPRVKSIEIPVHRLSAAQQEVVLGLELGDKVSTVRTPQGVGDPIELDFVVDGIRDQFAYGEWWRELYVAPTPTSAITPFTLGTSTLGGPDVLVY